MKNFIFLVIMLLCAGLLVSCAPPAQEPDSPSDSAFGGVFIDDAHINLKDISINKVQGETVVTLSLLSGSRIANYPETKLSQMPEFEITKLDQPQRIKITLRGISFWDYEPKSTWALSDFVVGLFHEAPADDDSLIVYIQLTRDASFTWIESDGNLILRITPLDENEGLSYFCVANAFLEHQEGRWPNDIDMQPVLCSDRQNKLLISAPFGTREEALDYKENMSALLSSALPDKEIHVISLQSGALPEYATDTDFALLEGRQIVQKDGFVTRTPLLLQNGKYLDTAPDGRIAFSRSYKPEKPAVDQDRYLLSERLWIRDANSRMQSVNIPPFFSISKAAFSPDGRYIAVLDVSIENRVLYVYDFDTQAIYNVSEEGFGSRVSSFAWSDTTLYAVTSDNTPRLMTFSIDPDDGVCVTEEGKLIGDGNIVISEGIVYVTDSTDGFVYRIGKTRRKLTSGSDLRISPDGKTLLVFDTNESQSEQLLTSLKLYDIETGEETLIVQDEQVLFFDFSQSGGKVYYTAAAHENDDFPYTLFMYDLLSGAATQEAMCSTAWFVHADAPATLYFIDYVQDGTESGFFATFTYMISN